LVLPDIKADRENSTFNVVALHDPRFRQPLLLACPVRLGGKALRGLYLDRWPVEQVPDAGKQMPGGLRRCQFSMFFPARVLFSQPVGISGWMLPSSDGQTLTGD